MKDRNIHELKTWPMYFEAVYTGKKNFEVRYNDRGYQVGDTLILREWDSETEKYTARRMEVTVAYVLHGGKFGIEDGYVVMGLE